MLREVWRPLSRHLRRSGAASASCLLAACANGAPEPRPPRQGPSPASVTRERPGGDAADPHQAALERLLEAPWGARRDRDDQLSVPLPDYQRWRRVRFWGVHHFTGFRYGDDHHAALLVFVLPTASGGEDGLDSQGCSRSFERWARRQARSYEPHLGSVERSRAEWNGRPLALAKVDGRVELAFDSYAFSLAWAAYPAFPEACLVSAVAVPWRGQPQLAARLRDRWLEDGLWRLMPFTEGAPQRLSP